MIRLGQNELTLDDVVAVARERRPVTLDPGARDRMRAARAVVDAALREGRVVYGLTTGFGELKNRHIPAEDARTLQTNLVRSHAAGVGPSAPRDVVRAMLLLRAASLARGHSGCRPELVEFLLEMLDREVTPIVPLQGSVGASGDLAPLAHLALVVIGEGEAWLGDQRMPAGLALRGAGLAPMVLEAKEGIALLNGTQLSTALAALACADAQRVWEAGMAAAALSIEAMHGSFAPAAERVMALRPYAGAAEAAKRLRAYAEGSSLTDARRDAERVQDAYSLRCVAPVMGASWDAIVHVEAQLEVEFNSVNDNPLVFPDTGDTVSAGLFHAQPVALVADYLKLAVAEVASIAERRIERLLDTTKSGLPAVLATNAGLESGYMMAQYTAAALVSENKTLAHPASVDSIPTGSGIEDHVSMAPIAGRHARQIVDNAARVVALELLCACRALEFRRPKTAGTGCERLYGAIRRIAPQPEGDRPLAGPTEDVTRWVLSDAPLKLVEEVLAP